MRRIITELLPQTHNESYISSTNNLNKSILAESVHWCMSIITKLIMEWCIINFSVYKSDVVVQWCSQGDLLAVAGMERLVMTSDPTRNAIVKFYNVCGEHIYSLETPAQVSLWS